MSPQIELTMFDMRNRSAVASPLDPRSGFHTPASRERDYSPVAGQDVSFDASIDSFPDSSTSLRNFRRSQTADHVGAESSQHLSPNDMIAPVSAVHSMSVNLLDSNHVSVSPEETEVGANHHLKIFMEHSAIGDARGDIVARGIVPEDRARVMYERYVPIHALHSILLNGRPNIT